MLLKLIHTGRIRSQKQKDEVWSTLALRNTSSFSYTHFSVIAGCRSLVSAATADTRLLLGLRLRVQGLVDHAVGVFVELAPHVSKNYTLKVTFQL